MATSNSSAVHRPIVRDLIGCAVILLFVVVVLGLAFGKIEQEVWWLILPCTTLSVFVIWGLTRKVGDRKQHAMALDISRGRVKATQTEVSAVVAGRLPASESKTG